MVIYVCVHRSASPYRYIYGMHASVLTSILKNIYATFFHLTKSGIGFEKRDVAMQVSHIRHYQCVSSQASHTHTHIHTHLVGY